jgi:D-alanyl-D-alanine carboxypeptidase (penicillin-binding protein 5/6)
LKQILIKVALLGSSAFLLLMLPGETIKKADSFPKPEILGAKTTDTPAPAPITKLKSSPEISATIELPVLTAKSSLAFDVQSGAVLYSDNHDEKLPIASLTKLMTAVVAVGKLDYDSTATITKDDVRVIGTNMGLLPEEKIKVIDLLKGLLISSSNDAAKALARTSAGSEQNFVALMNQKAKALDMYSTHFSNSTGLDSFDNYSTAHDLTRIVSEFIKNPVLNEIAETKEAEVKSIDGKISHKLITTNKLLLEDPTVIGLKTGFTALAKGNLIIRAKENRGEIVTIILNSDDRETDTKKLMEWILAVYKW